ncbi:hypothetical protein BC826DRAFT_742463 [Russula brevipes]|nr:hypothetical protein BC826DRAFT_742463 [Russula brevipes]
MSLHDALSDASMISRASRSPSVACSVRESSVGAITPARSLASPMSILQRQPSTTEHTHSPTVASDQDVRIQFNSGDNIRWSNSKERGISEGTPSGSPRELASNISPASVISRASSIADQVIILDSFKGRGVFRRSSESTLPDFTASSQHSRAVSAAGSLMTPSMVAASETGSPASSARSIFARAPSVASTSPAQAAPAPLTFSGLLASAGLGDVSPTKESFVEIARSRASSLRSISTGDRTGSISPSSIKTVSPPPSHSASVLPSPNQRERFRITPVNSNNPSRAGSPPKSGDSSERTHSPGQGTQVYWHA